MSRSIILRGFGVLRAMDSFDGRAERTGAGDLVTLGIDDTEDLADGAGDVVLGFFVGAGDLVLVFFTGGAGDLVFLFFSICVRLGTG